jgi:hypothetical protein
MEKPPVPEALRHKAEAAVRKNGTALVNPATGILEVAAGASSDAPGQPAVIVYVDRAKSDVPVPQMIGGVRTLVVPTDQSSLNAGNAPDSSSYSGGVHLAPEVLASARGVQSGVATHLMSDPAIFGVGITQSRDNPSEAALLVLVDSSRTPRSTPAVIGGLRTRYVVLHRFHVTRSKHTAGPSLSGCQVRSLAAHRDAQRFDPNAPSPLPLPR